MNLQDVINSRFAMNAALWLTRLLPPRPGYRLAGYLAGLIADRRSAALIQTVRLNQWVARGRTLDAAGLDRAVHETLRTTAHSLYDAYHYLRDADAMKRLIRLPESFDQLLARNQRRREGSLVVGPHLSNFEFVAHAAGQYGIRALALGLPQPAEGHKVQYEMRRETGVVFAPSSRAAFKEAVELLRDGGTVVTGIDRPVENARLKFDFFGHPAPLPYHHLMLAKKAGVPIFVTAVCKDAAGIYQLSVSDEIHLEERPNRDEELVLNAGRLLGILEDQIRPVPEQWAMFYPVWPDLLAQLP